MILGKTSLTTESYDNIRQPYHTRTHRAHHMHSQVHASRASCSAREARGDCACSARAYVRPMGSVHPYIPYNLRIT